MSPPCYMSFGAGVQSTALAFLALERHPRLMKATGGIVPQSYIFADTSDERVTLYQHVEKMRELLGDRLISVRRKGGSLSDQILRKAHANTGGMACLPFFVRSRDGRSSPIRRSCTSNFKIQVLDRAARKLLGVKRGRLNPSGESSATAKILEALFVLCKR